MIENNLSKQERKLVAEIRTLKSRLARFEQNEPKHKQVAHALQENETSFCTLFDNMAQGVFYQMSDGHIRKANQAMLDIFGLTLDQLQRRTSMTKAWRVIHEDGSEFPGETHPSLLALKTGKEIRNVTAGIFNAPKNDYVWVSINAIPEFRTGEDKPYQVFVTMHDITERKLAETALQESEEKFRLLLENCPDLIIMQCPKGLATFISNRAEAVVGHPAHLFEGKGFPDIIHPDDLDGVREKYVQIVEGGEEVLDFEYRIIDGNGDVRWISHTARQILKDGKTCGFQSNIRNITKRKHIEEILKKQQYYLEKGQEIGRIGTWELDIQQNILKWTDETFRIFGLLIGRELTYETFLNCIHPDDRDYVHEAWSAALKHGTYDIEHRLMVDGKVKWVREKAEVEFDKQGNAVRGIGFAQDITNRKQAEETLRRSDERIRDSLDRLMEGCQIVGYDWRFLYLNDSAARQGRKPKEEFLGRTMMDVLPGIEDSDMFARLKQCMEERKKQHMENEFTYYDGQKSWFELSIQPVQEGIFILSIDITERKRAGEALRLSEQRLELAHEASGMGMFDWDIENDQAVCNERYFRLFGLEPQERMLSEENWLAMVHPDDRERAQREVNQTVRQGAPYGTEYRVICPDGSERWVSSTAKMFHTNDGKLSRMIGGITDTTQRKQAEERLRDSEKRSRAWLEYSPVCTKIVDLDFNLQYMSTAGIEGLKIDDITQFYGTRYPFDFYPESFRNRMTGSLAKVKETGEIITQEASVVDIEGNELWFHSTLVPVNDDEGRIEYIIVVSVDTTKRKQAEQALVNNQAQLKSLASELVLAEERERNRIAVHLHDDVCQNLAYAKMNLQIVNAALDDQTHHDNLVEVSDTLTRIMQDVQSLTFELSPPILTEFGFEAAVSHWLTEQIKQKHDIATEFTDDGQAKPLQDDIKALLFRSIRELLVNIVKHSEAKRVEVSISREEDQILIRLEDDGIGFAPDKVVVGRDTGGFGLFSIRERLSQLGGSLEIDSSPGQGCRSLLRAPLQQS
jgi:PAS domain S-box-containing protein